MTELVNRRENHAREVTSSTSKREDKDFDGADSGDSGTLEIYKFIVPCILWDDWSIDPVSWISEVFVIDIDPTECYTGSENGVVLLALE